MGEIAIVLALGLAAGILGGFVGVGGGVLIVPVLVLALGFDQHLQSESWAPTNTTSTVISTSRTRCCSASAC
jgi:uncharacterized membrane protein YfcA